MIKDSLLKFVPFTNEELDDILSQFEKEDVKKNEVLLNKGKVCYKLYFIEKGIGRSFYLKNDGKEVTQWFFGEGSFMSSVDSFFQQSPSFYSIDILEDSIVYSITKGKMDLLLAKYHHMEKFVRLLTIETLAKFVQKLNAIQFQTAKERYNYMLTEYPKISHRVPLGYISSYLGMTQETLSRIRSND
tara:strand:+ start:632 stop:1192 length:561 start_codon:yes stop_codon:yes gene_type:complete